MIWETLLDPVRLGREGAERLPPGRSGFERDYQRVLFSNPFRRLQDKTQVFPMPANDHVHNRMTHSLEVASVGQSLGKAVGARLHEGGQLPEGYHPRDLGEIVQAACLMHDLGNPPLGHAGEDAIGSWFQRQRDLSEAERGHDLARLIELTEDQWSDLCAFEGNAQTFRIVARLEMYQDAGGMQLTGATLGAALKYPQPVAGRQWAGLPPELPKDQRPVAWKKFNVFEAERTLFEGLAGRLGLPEHQHRLPDGRLLRRWGRHPLAFLVEAADDLCYHLLDLEDGFLLGLLSYEELGALLDPLAQARPPTSHRDAKSRAGYLRAKAIARGVDQLVEAFVRHHDALLAGEVTATLAALIPGAAALDDIQRFSVERCYNAPEVVRVELAGYRVIGELLDLFVPAALAESPKGRLGKIRCVLGERFEEGSSAYTRLLQVTDFISGMTDRYAVRLYREVTGQALPEVAGRPREVMGDGALRWGLGE